MKVRVARPARPGAQRDIPCRFAWMQRRYGGYRYGVLGLHTAHRTSYQQCRFCVLSARNVFPTQWLEVISLGKIPLLALSGVSAEPRERETRRPRPRSPEKLFMLGACGINSK